MDTGQTKKDASSANKGSEVNEKKHMIERPDDGNKAKRPKLTEDSTPSDGVVGSGGSSPAPSAASGMGTPAGDSSVATTPSIKMEEGGATAGSSSSISTPAATTGGGAPGLATAETLSPPPGAAQNTPEVSEEEQRKKQEEMRRIEMEFTQLKERFFNEKITMLKKEIEQLNTGTHVVFLQEVKHLEERRTKKMLLAEYWRKFHSRCVDIYTESEKKTADDEFQSETKELQDRMMKNIVKKRKQLEDEKRDLNLNVTDSSGDNAQNQSQRANTRTLRKRGKDASDGLGVNGLGDAPPKKPNTPDIRVMLSDEEMEHDIMTILRGQLPSAL